MGRAGAFKPSVPDLNTPTRYIYKISTTAVFKLAEKIDDFLKMLPALVL